MISFKDLTMIHGNKLLFHQVNLNLNEDRRYGLVGANGSGKTTLLKLISKEEKPNEGDITVPKSKQIGWLNQDHFKYENEIIVNVVLKGNINLWEALLEKDRLLNLKSINDEQGIKLAECEEIIALENGYFAESQAQILLSGMGIDPKFHFQPLSTLSGGYKMRVLLAQALFKNPDILLLDEPTNHLDLMSTVWLENYLIKDYKGLLIFISHDRDFLNRLSTDILDIDYGDIRHYPGSYDHFVTEKQLVVEQKLHAQKYLSKKVSEMQRFVDRFRASASKAKLAQSRMKMIEKIQLPTEEQSSRRSLNLSFSQIRASGKAVLKVTHLSKEFNQKALYSNLNFTLSRGDKVAIIGHNGIGKSTLLKQLLGFIPCDKGQAEWGYETRVSYFAQNHHELFTDNLSVFNWLKLNAPDQSEQTVYSILGRMLFQKDDVNKNIFSLSGGESSRLLLAKMIIDKANVLIFDEPTNHLDIESTESLITALTQFEGSILLVSHNRYFVSKIATRIFAMTEKGITDFQGKYPDFVNKFGHDYLSQAWLVSQSQK